MRQVCVGNLASGLLGFLTFMVLTPVREEHVVSGCIRGDLCPDVQHCYTLLGWQDALGPLSCSRWSAAAAGLLVALLLHIAGRCRSR